MDARGFIAVVMLVFLSLWGALYLEAGLNSYYVAELFIIFLMIIASIGILYAIETKKKWAWHSLSAFFVIALANSALLYFAAGSRPGYAAFIFVNIISWKKSRLNKVCPCPQIRLRVLSSTIQYHLFFVQVGSNS